MSLLHSRQGVCGRTQRSALVSPRAALPARFVKSACCSPQPLKVSALVNSTLPKTKLQQNEQHQWPAAADRRSVVACSSSSASGDASSSEPTQSPNLVQALKVPFYIFLWYAFNIIFNIMNKSTLNTFPCPYLISTWQLAASGLFMVFLWVFRLQPVPRVDAALFKALLPVALFHTIGHVSACVSFSQMAVSFAHIVKSAEPVFSVALSGPMLGINYPWYVWGSLLPIVAGCSLSAMKEVSFAWSGFNNAMISNVGMVLRNILSKKSLANYKHIDGINLFGLISIVSLLYCLPLALLMESNLWAGAWDTAVAKMGQGAFIQLLVLGGIFYHLYNQLSYMVLDQGVSAVTFSVGNTMKRVAVVVSSVMFFKNPVSLMNWVGSFIAIFGTYLYSVATDKYAEEKKKAAAAKTA